MKQKTLLTLALSASLASFGALAQDINSGSSSAGAGAGGDMGAPGSGMSAAQPFDKLDANKDGSISKEEARNNNIDKQFSQADTDQDGKISQSEYQAWSQSSAAGAGAGGAGGEGPGDVGDAAGPTQAPLGSDQGVPGAPPAGSPTTPGGTSGP